MIHVRPAVVDDRPAWLAMREALWPDETGAHAREVHDYFAGLLTMPLEVMLALDDAGLAVGFAELSIRPYAEECETDRVAYLKGGTSFPVRADRGLVVH